MFGGSDGIGGCERLGRWCCLFFFCIFVLSFFLSSFLPLCSRAGLLLFFLGRAYLSCPLDLERGILFERRVGRYGIRCLKINAREGGACIVLPTFLESMPWSICCGLEFFSRRFSRTRSRIDIGEAIRVPLGPALAFSPSDITYPLGRCLRPSLGMTDSGVSWRERALMFIYQTAWDQSPRRKERGCLLFLGLDGVSLRKRSCLFSEFRAFA